MVRRDKPKKTKKTNPMPLVIGGGAVGGVVLIGLIVWLVLKPGSGGQSAKQSTVTPAAAPSGPAVPPHPASELAAGASQPAAAAPSSAATASAAKADLFAYLPSGLDAMAGARVAEAIKVEDKVLVRGQLDSVLRPVVSRTGLKLDDIAEVVMGAGSQPDQLLIAVRTGQPVDAAAIRKSMGCTAGPQRINQFDLFPLPLESDSAEFVTAFMDPKTFLIGSKALIRQSLESSTGATTPSVLKDVMAATGVKTHLWVVAKMGILKPQVAQLAGFGVAENLFAPSLDKIGLVAMGYDLSTGMQLRMALECNSDGEAKLVRGVVDSVRVALREAEKKQAFVPGGGNPEGEGTSSGPPSGGPGAGPGGAGGPGGMSGGARPPGSPGTGMPGTPGMSGPMGGAGGGGMPGGGGNTTSAPGAVWDATEVKQVGSHVLVTLPPLKVVGESLSSPLDLFGSATQAGFARSAIGSPLFPGSLRRTSQALRALEQQDGTIPAGAFYVEKFPQPIARVSWLASLLPYLGYQELHDQISFADEWTDKKNIPVAATIVDAFLDPMVPLRRWKGPPLEGVALAHYVGMGGVGPEAPRLPKEHPKSGIFGYDRKTALADVRDGVSNTIMMIQVRDVFGPWIQGGGATVRAAQSQPYIGAMSGFGSPGNTGAMTIFADGSVRFLSKDIDPKVFEALCTINGGEKVDLALIAPANSASGPPAPAPKTPTPASPAAAPQQAAGSDSELTAYELKDEGFSVSLPSRWRSLDLKKLDDELKVLQQQNSQLAAAIAPSVRAVVQLGAKFYAFDAKSISSGFMSNINVMKEVRPTPINLDDYVAQNLKLIETIPIATKPINHQRVKLTAGDAERLDYGLNLPTPKGQLTVRVVQYLLINENVAISLTLTALSDSAAEHFQIFEKIGNGFRFLN
jgi:hypothetical protein